MAKIKWLVLLVIISSCVEREGPLKQTERAINEIMEEYRRDSMMIQQEMKLLIQLKEEELNLDNLRSEQ